MLQLLRNKAQSIVIQAIIVIISLVFIFWGVGTKLMNNRNTALTINGEEVSLQQYQKAYDRAYQNMAAQFGGTLPKGFAKTLNLKQRVINQLVQTALLRQGADQMGLVVSREEVRNTIAKMAQFEVNGAFNIQKYNSLLAANHLTPNQFESDMRHDMLADKTVKNIGKFVAIAGDYQAKQLYLQDKEKISVNYVSLQPDTFAKDVKVDQKDLAAWYATVKQNYQSEPEMQLKYIAFTFSDVGRKITVSDDEIKNYYEQHKAQYTIPEKRQARHILLRVKADDSSAVKQDQLKKAEKILALARSGKDFASLAKQYSEGPTKDSGGELGFFAKGDMVPSFDKAVFSMKVGQISGIVKSRFGYHIIKLEAIQPAKTESLAEVHDKIRDLLRENQAKPLAFQLANSAYEGIISAGSLENYAKNHPQQRIIETKFFTRANPPKELDMSGEFLDKAFSLNKGELSSLVKTSDGYYIIYAEGVKAPVTPTLEQVKEKATKDFIAARAETMAAEAAKKMLSELRAGKSFSEIAQKAGLTLEKSGFIDHSGTGETTFPATLTQQVFTLSAANPYRENPGKVGGDYYVFAFRDRQLPEITTTTDLSKYRQQLLQNKRQQLLNAYIANLESKSKITRNPNL